MIALALASPVNTALLLECGVNQGAPINWTSYVTYAALDLTVSNVVHPPTVHRQHLCCNPS
jgi:hypothetical protein